MGVFTLSDSHHVNLDSEVTTLSAIRLLFLCPSHDIEGSINENALSKEIKLKSKRLTLFLLFLPSPSPFFTPCLPVCRQVLIVSEQRLTVPTMASVGGELPEALRSMATAATR